MVNTLGFMLYVVDLCREVDEEVLVSMWSPPVNCFKTQE